MHKFIYSRKSGIYYPVEKILRIVITYDGKKVTKLFHRCSFDEKTDLDKDIWKPLVVFVDKEPFSLSNEYFTYKECEALVNKYFDFLNDPDKQVFVIDYDEGD